MYSRAYESDKREPEEFVGAQRAAPSLISLSRKDKSPYHIKGREHTRDHTSTHPSVIEGGYFQNRRDRIENRLTSRDPTIDNRDFPFSDHRDVAPSTLQSIAFV